MFLIGGDSLRDQALFLVQYKEIYQLRQHGSRFSVLA